MANLINEEIKTKNGFGKPNPLLVAEAGLEPATFGL